jgi:hypothetical protein
MARIEAAAGTLVVDANEPLDMRKSSAEKFTALAV